MVLKLVSRISFSSLLSAKTHGSQSIVHGLSGSYSHTRFKVTFLSHLHVWFKLQRLVLTLSTCLNIPSSCHVTDWLISINKYLNIYLTEQPMSIHINKHRLYFNELFVPTNNGLSVSECLTVQENVCYASQHSWPATWNLCARSCWELIIFEIIPTMHHT